jgi:hypothetical protein
MDKRQEDIDRLLQLPQESDVWQFGVNQWSDEVFLACRGWHPWLMMVYSITNQTVLADFPFHIGLPSEDFLRSMLVRAMADPYRSVPHRPTELQLRDETVGNGLKRWIEQLGIVCVLTDTLEAVERVLFDAGEAFFGKAYRLVPGGDPIWFVGPEDD